MKKYPALAALFEHVSRDGRTVRPSQQRALRIVAWRLDQSKPKYACPICWMMRCVRGLEGRQCA